MSTCSQYQIHQRINSTQQVSLLRLTWNELFLLNSAQTHFYISSPSLLASLHATPNSPAFISYMEQIRIFQELLKKLKLLQMDAAEFSCLKAIVLFSSGELPLVKLNHLKNVKILFNILIT